MEGSTKRRAVWCVNVQPPAKIEGTSKCKDWNCNDTGWSDQRLEVANLDEARYDADRDSIARATTAMCIHVRFQDVHRDAVGTFPGRR